MASGFWRLVLAWVINRPVWAGLMVLVPWLLPAAGLAPGASSWVDLGGARFGLISPTGAAGAGIRYRVLVERGLSAEGPGFAERVAAVLADSRGWADAGVTFRQVNDDAEITFLLARPDVVDRLCHPLDTAGELSCGRHGRVTVNVLRWRFGAHTWGKDLEGYRSYLLNHEVGHVLGLDHAPCSAAGDPAPVMLPQTRSLGGCRPSAWPSPAERHALRTRLGLQRERER